MARKTLPAGHAELGALLVNVGRYERQRGRLAEAQAMLEEALQIMEKTLGTDHVRTVAARSALGELYTVQRRYESAEAAYRRVLAALERIMRQTSDRAGTLASLAVICRARGRFTEAERFYRRALPIWESILPPEEYAKKLRELGDLYRADGRPRDAREMEESARKVSFLSGQ